MRRQKYLPLLTVLLYLSNSAVVVIIISVYLHYYYEYLMGEADSSDLLSLSRRKQRQRNLYHDGREIK